MLALRTCALPPRLQRPCIPDGPYLSGLRVLAMSDASGFQVGARQGGGGGAAQAQHPAAAAARLEAY